jgi:hypothetical protein
MISSITFDQILDLVENLSRDEQEVLIDVMQHRLLEKRRAEIAASITEADAEYEKGKVFRGNVAEIMAELKK